MYSSIRKFIPLAFMALLFCASDAPAENGRPNLVGKEMDTHFGSSQLKIVFERVHAHTGARFLYNDTLVAIKPVTIWGQAHAEEKSAKIPVDQAIEFLRRILEIHDLVLVDVPGELETYRVQQENKPGTATKLYDPNASEDSEIVTHIFKIKHTNPQTLGSNFSRMASVPNAVFTIPNSNKIMITDHAWSIRRFARLIAQLDLPQPEIISIVYNLKNARADKVAVKIESLMTILTTSETRATGRQAQTVPPVTIDEQTNTVIVFATERLQKKVADLIEQLDEEIKVERYMHIYKIMNTEAAAIAYMLGELLDADVGSGFEGSSGASISNTAPGGDATTSAPSQSGSNAIVSAQTRESRRRAETESEVYGQEIPLVIPDLNQNALIVNTTKEVHATVESLIEDLDARRPQVLIEVAVVEISDNDTLNIGFEFSSLMTRSNADKLSTATGFGLAGTVIEATKGVFNGKTIGQPAGILAAYSTRDKIAAVLRAVQIHTKVKVLSTPILLVKDNQEAHFTSKEGQPTTTRSQGVNSDAVTFDQFVEAGIDLSIHALISEGNYITLTISQNIDSFVGTPSSPGVPPPVNTNSINTVVIVPNDEMVIIGGLTTARKQKAVTKVPFLGDLPLIGFLFQDSSKVNSSSKIYVFVRPLIMDDPNFSDLKGYSQNLHDKAGLKRGQPKPISEKLLLDSEPVQ